MRRALAIVALGLATAAQAAQQTGDLVRFVTCPLYRDTDAGRKSGCWLAADPATGQRWDVTDSPHKPDWNFAVLVEGRVSADPAQPCGAPVLEPVRTSRLATACTRHIIPAEAFPGRRFALPRRNIAPLSVPRPVPPGPYAERVFRLFFEFDKDFLIYQYDDWLVDQMVTWIRAAQPRRLRVTGFAATDPETTSGVTLAERPEVARSRAEAVAETLRRLVPGIAIETATSLAAQPVADPEADGLPGQSRRRVEVQALF